MNSENITSSTQHFICTGECHGVSPVSGTCQSETCSEFAEPLQACSCDDPTHGAQTGDPDASCE